MYLTGFCEPLNRGRSVNIRNFLIHNTVGLAKWRGLCAKDIYVDVIKLPPECGEAVSRLWNPKWDVATCRRIPMAIWYNLNTLVDEAFKRNGCVGIETLWRIVARALRLWVVYHEKIQKDDLFVSHDLEEYGNAEALECLRELFSSQEWTPDRMRAEVDAAFVAGLISTTVSTFDLSLDLDFMDQFARFIFESRKNKWEMPRVEIRNRSKA